MANLDQGVRITDTELKLFDTVQDVVDRSVIAGDPLPAFEFAAELIRSGQIRGKALANLLYLLKSKWEIFRAAGLDDNFEDVAFAQTGASPETTTKYIRMWESIFENDKVSQADKRKLLDKNIGDLLLMTALVREGVDENTMQELITAPDTNSIRDIVKGERGGRTSSNNALRLFLQLKDEGRLPRGCIYLKRGSGPEIVGSLDVDSEDENIKKAIARIVNSAGITEIN